MGLFSGIKKVGKVIGRGAKGIVKGAVRRVKKAAKSFVSGVKGFASKLGPLGTIALIAAAVYFTGPAGAGWWGTSAAETAAITSASTEVAATGVASQAAAGTVSMTEGLVAGATTAGESAALGGAGAESLFASSALGETAAAGSVAGSSGLGALGVELAPSAYAGAGTFSAGAELAFADTTGAAALGGSGTAVGEGLGAGSSSEGIDYKKYAKAAAKSLLGGGTAADGSYLPSTVAPPELSPSEPIKSISAGTGSNLGFSKFTEEAAAGLTAGARQAEQYYKSLLAKGVR